MSSALFHYVEDPTPALLECTHFALLLLTSCYFIEQNSQKGSTHFFV